MFDQSFKRDFRDELEGDFSEILQKSLRRQDAHGREMIAQEFLRCLVKEVGFLACISGLANIAHNTSHLQKVVPILEQAEMVCRGFPEQQQN